MKRFSTILSYLKNQKGKIFLYLLFTLLSIIFSLISLGLLAPFLQMIFEPPMQPIAKPVLSFSSSSLMEYLRYGLAEIIKEHNKVWALAAICITLIVSILLKNLCIYMALRMMIPLRNNVMTQFREDLYTKILKLPIGFFTEQRKGDIMSRMSNDLNEIEWSIMSTLEGLIRDPLNIIIILFALVFLSPALSLFLLILLPATGFIIGRVSRKLKKQSGAAQEEQGILLSILDETITGLRVVKSFNAEKILGSRFLKTSNNLHSLRVKMAFRRDLASPLSEFLGIVILSAILWFGGQLVLNGTEANPSVLAPGAFITYIVFFTQIINPAKSLSTAFYNAQRGSAAIARVEEILKAPVVVEEAANPVTMQTFNNSIEFRNVSFKYEDVTILDDINLTIEKGKTIALVGSSGAGKSTLADLVPRFHDVSSGELLIDGVNIKDISLLSLRDQIGIVTQEPILFNDTIASNIALGNPVATIDEIEHAARIANAHDFIMKKDENYQTNIGDRGSKLSGGERQRLTIARAVLKNPPILILDEATSSLDTESERLVQDAINKMMANRTSIVIAHRLSTIRHADEIIVLQRGKIVERGTHDQLIALEGFYNKLVKMQEVK
ncbi:ABC transporter ATP-binding protein [Pseudoflavitalea sp. G-6-1-2]|uniref:ABC transporter ATP-binding protein n=1 Tax=Pseudoflavitalea sp. G-6-1-2 TaxID=2728841 RepID=UPI00146D9961|nr:ABC transporter ATP-binding protein [Pseudoflavitalea sp. G-6-1-2]NML20427.1 ABC transporter ATP-binding protein [Pseudoflavitalea sp. G-6-1-2]